MGVEPPTPVTRLVRLPCRLESLRPARDAVDELPIEAGIKDDVRLLVSQLVTEAIQLAAQEGQDVEILLDARPTRVRVEVRGPQLPSTQGVRRERPLDAIGRRLVRALSSRWGEGDGDSALVWFEIDRRPARNSPLM